MICSFEKLRGEHISSLSATSMLELCAAGVAFDKWLAVMAMSSSALFYFSSGVLVVETPSKL